MMTSIRLGLILLLVYKSNCADHTIIVPKAFRIDASESILLNLHGYDRATVSAYLQDPINPSSRFGRINDVMLNANTAVQPVIMNMKVSSDDIDVTQQDLRVLLVIQVTNSNENFVKTLGVLVTKQSGYIFVTTDKPVYRPGESLSIVLSTLDQSMRQYGNSFVTITIKNSLGHGVGKMERLQTSEAGFMGTFFDLDENAELGLYKAEVKFSNASYETSSVTNFAVMNYDLPLFKLSMDIANPFVFLTDKEVELNVKTSHSSSIASVQGSLSISVTLKKTPSSIPELVLNIPENFFLSGRRFVGDITVSFPLSRVNRILGEGESLSSLAAAEATLIIEASVIDLDTGTIESTAKEIPFVTSPYRIVTDRASGYFTPRAQYRLQVDIVDAVGQRPRPDVAVQILVLQGEVRAILTRSDENGQINFLIDMPDSKGQILMLTTVDPDLDSSHQASAFLQLRAYQSASNSYLQIQQNARLQRVGTNSLLTFTYNQDITEIRFFVLARGSIVAAGTNSPIPSNRQSTDFIQITQKMVPSARVVAYYFKDEELVSDSLWFDVEDQCKTDLTSNIPEVVPPSVPLGIDISGSRNGVVGLQGFNGALNVFSDGSRLSRKDMFNKMASYDQGCRKDGRDGLEVFWNAGVTMSSKENRQLFVDSLQCDSLVELRTRSKRQTMTEDSHEDCLAYFTSTSVFSNKSFAQWLNQFVKEKDVISSACKRQFFDTYKKAYPNLRLNTLSSTVIQKREKKVTTRRFRRTPAMRGAAVRTNFEEQVFGTILNLNEEGRTVYNVRAPDSIATFQIESLSSENEEDGFCIENSVEVRVHKDVFIKILPPYTLQRLKETTIKIAVFNDCPPDSISVDLEVRLEKNILCSRYSSGQWTKLATVSIETNRARVTSLPVLPLRIPRDGTTSMDVRAITNSGQIIDSVFRPFAVKASGTTQFSSDTYSFNVDQGRKSTFAIPLRFPERVISSTRKCYVIAQGLVQSENNVVKPLSYRLNDLESFFKQPIGIGYASAQISGVNIYVHDYLVSQGKLLPNTPAYVDSVRRITDGYNRLLQGRRRQFVENGSPSLWLNAFIVKVFSKAKTFIPTIQTSALCEAVVWILNQQVENEFFQELNPVFHQQFKIPGSDSENLIFTTHILIFLLEAQANSTCSAQVNQRVQVVTSNGIAHLVSNKDSKLFTENRHAIAMLSYLLNLYDEASPITREVFVRLLETEMASKKPYWEARSLSYTSGRSYHNYWYNVQRDIANVETRAYALLVLIARLHTPEVPRNPFAFARDLASWLIRHHNEGGKLAAPEETMVTMQALTAYRNKIGVLVMDTSSLNLTVTISTALRRPDPVLKINEFNARSQIRTELTPDVIDEESFTAVVSGKGAGVLTYTCSYQTAEDPSENCHFNIEHEIRILNQQAATNENALLRMTFTMHLSVASGESPTEVAVVAIGLLSGFAVNEQSLIRALSQLSVDGQVNRFEMPGTGIIIYLQRITSSPLTLSFEMTQTVADAQPIPGRITVFDYYEPMISCDVPYSLPSQGSMLRTSQCDVASGDNSLCECAEGDCATCRTRDDQVSATLCLRRGPSCDTCDENRSCQNMFARACRSNYAYVVNITTVHNSNPREIFINFEGEIMELLKFGDDLNAERGRQLRFTMRRDCYLSCKDDALVESRESGSSYITPGRIFLIIGSAPEAFLNRNGRREYSYRLDEAATLERFIPPRTCERYHERNARYRGNCNNARTPSRRERCERTKKLIGVCSNHANLRERLQEGCD